jgi:hypothetical protein
VSYSGLALHIWECLDSDFDIEADNPDRFMTFRLAISWVSTFRLVILTSFDVRTASPVRL